MEYKYPSLLLLVSISTVLCLRIPANPCPNVFQYYKDSQGNIYGEAVVPYDNATYMEFTVNASFVGQYNEIKLRLEMATELRELNDFTKNVIYNIYFPFTNVIPKITQIVYNNQVYCSGPAEPLIPGEHGITNVWHQLHFRFTRVPSRFQQTFVDKDTSDVDISDVDIPVKNPNERPFSFKPPKQPPIVIPTTSSTTTPSPPAPTPPDLTPIVPVVPELPPKSSQLEPEPVDQGLIDTLFTRPEEATLSPIFTFTSPSISANNEFKCGVPGNQPPNNAIVPLIFGGSDTDIGQFPWLVALFSKTGNKYDYKCSANLISDNHVLTAARCVQYYKIQIIKTEQIFLIMGTNSLQNWNSNGATTRKASRVDVHPAFKENSKSAHGDLAVITIDRPIQFTKVLSPVCLWKGSTDLYPLTDKMGVIAGFGQDEEAQANGMIHALRAKRAELPIISQTECLTSPLGFKDVTSDRTFCTKSFDTATGPCIGDSGTGFFIFMDGAYYLRGIASAISVQNGICDLSNKYSVFCDVAKFLDWIKINME